MCFARFISVLTSLPPLPLHTLSTPSFLDVRMSPPGRSYGHCCEALARGLCNCKHACTAQCAVPLSLLFSFLAPPAMLRTDCCCFAHREEQEHSPGSRTCGPLPIALLRANLQLSPLLILCSLLLCAISHSMDAMSMPCHLLQVCVQGAGVGQEREPLNLQLAFPAPQTRFLIH